MVKKQGSNAGKGPDKASRGPVGGGKGAGKGAGKGTKRLDGPSKPRALAAGAKGKGGGVSKPKHAPNNAAAPSGKTAPKGTRAAKHGSSAGAKAATGADKKAAKLQRLERKKPVVALIKRVVALWDEMRPAQVSAEQKRALAAQIVSAGRGHLRELALNHASSRAVQAAVKHGGAEARAAVWGECKEGAVDLALSPHGSFVVRKLIATADKAELSGALGPLRSAAAVLVRGPLAGAHRHGTQYCARTLVCASTWVLVPPGCACAR